MKNKYGIIKECKHCSTEFETRPRYVDYCSTPCKNPNNRPGNVPWNKGRKGRQRNHNTSGLSKGHGWNKGVPNPELSERMLGENNPNWNGKVNRERYKDHVPNTEYQQYKREVYKYTYRTINNVLAPQGLVPDNVGKYSDDMQCDHIIPIKQGYAENISAELLGQAPNLQYITGEDNRKKWDDFQTPENRDRILKECANG